MNFNQLIKASLDATARLASPAPCDRGLPVTRQEDELASRGLFFQASQTLQPA